MYHDTLIISDTVIFYFIINLYLVCTIFYQNDINNLKKSLAAI